MAVYQLVKAPALQGAPPVPFADIRSVEPILPGDVVEVDGLVYQVKARMFETARGVVLSTSLMCAEIGKVTKTQDGEAPRAHPGIIIPRGGR